MKRFSRSRFTILVPALLLLFFLSLLPNKMHRAPWYEQWIWNTLSPITHLFSWSRRSAGNVWSHYFYLVGAARENENLRTELGRLEQLKADHESLLQENARLLNLLELRSNKWPQAIAARVFAFDPKMELKSIRINKGSEDGIVTDMPVIAVDGLVGRVGPVFKRDAMVLLIVDPASFVDVMVHRSQVRALLAGLGSVKHLELGHFQLLSRMEYLKKESEITVGDTIVTSGMDLLYPAGILVGTVESLQINPYGVFLRAEILPAADFTKLREVLVLQKS